MAINKVVYGNNTLVDLTNDSVSANNLLEGETAHDRSGNPVTGTAKQGHIVQNSSGTDMTQRSKMQFPDSFVSDDAVNGKTIVENIKEVAPADYDSTTDEGIIVTDDGNDVPIGEIEEDYVEVEGDGNKTYATLLNEIATEMDFSKVRDSAYLAIIYANGAKNISVLRANYGTSVTFFQGLSENKGSRIRTYYIEDSNSVFEESTGSSYSDKSTNTLADGAVIRLYYGTSSTVINLKTSADYCMMSDGVTSVEEALSSTGLGSFANLTSLETAIKNKLGTMKAGDIKSGTMSTSQSFAPFNMTGGFSIIIQSRADNNSTIGMVQVWNQIGMMHYGFCNNGTFTWKKPTLT